MENTPAEILEQAMADIEEWMTDNGAESFVSKLRPGASDADIEAAQAHFEAPLPPLLAALYRRNDGQSGDVEPFFEHMFFLPFEEACRLRSVLLQCYFAPPGGMSIREYHRGHPYLSEEELSSRAWFPFANTDGDFLAVNLESGQVVRVLKGELPWIRLVGADLAGFVGEYASGLWDGHYELCGDLEQPGVTEAGLIWLSRYLART